MYKNDMQWLILFHARQSIDVFYLGIRTDHKVNPLLYAEVERMGKLLSGAKILKDERIREPEKWDYYLKTAIFIGKQYGPSNRWFRWM